MEDIVYFELNDWFRGEDYPNEEPFVEWMKGTTVFTNEDWIRKNKLVVVAARIDMSINVCVSATRSWVENNCPSLLTKYTKFLRYEDNDGNVLGNFYDFIKYDESEIGLHIDDDHEWW